MTHVLSRWLSACKSTTLATLLFLGTQVLAQDFVWAPEFPVGGTITAIEASDQNGQIRTLANLAGENGLLLMFSRSFDW